MQARLLAPPPPEDAPAGDPPEGTVPVAEFEALLLVGGGGVAAFAYGNTRGLRPVIGAAAVAFGAAGWDWGVERGGALGAVFALALTAALLFWISGRTGDPDE